MNKQTIIKSYNGNYALYKKTGTLKNGKPYKDLSVESYGIADKHVIRIRLEGQCIETDDLVTWKYTDAEVTHGMRMKSDTLEETKEYVEALNEAVSFVGDIKKVLETEDWDYVDVIYTGGGIWIATKYISEHVYVCLSNDEDSYITAFDDTDEDEPYMNVIWEKEVDDMDKEDLKLYAQLLKALKDEMN